MYNKLNQEEVIVEHLLKDVFDPVYTVTGLATIASYTSSWRSMRCNCTMARILTSSSSSLLSAESENCSMRHTPTVVLRDRRLVDCVLRYIALFVRIGTDFSFVMKE